MGSNVQCQGVVRLNRDDPAQSIQCSGKFPAPISGNAQIKREMGGKVTPKPRYHGMTWSWDTRGARWPRPRPSALSRPLASGKPMRGRLEIYVDCPRRRPLAPEILHDGAHRPDAVGRGRYDGSFSAVRPTR